MVEDGVDRLLVAVHHLQHAVGQAGLLHQFGQHQRHRGVALGGLEDEGVAAGDGRAHLPHRDHRREVERGDAGDDAERLAHRIHVDAGAGAVGELALQQMRRADAELGDLEAADHVALGVGQGLAVLARQRLGQLVHVAVQQLDELHHHPRAALRVGGGPVRPGRAAAPATAASSSAALASGTRACTSPVAGLKTSAKRPDVPGDALAVDEMRELLHGVPPDSVARNPSGNFAAAQAAILAGRGCKFAVRSRPC